MPLESFAWQKAVHPIGMLLCDTYSFMHESRVIHLLDVIEVDGVVEGGGAGLVPEPLILSQS